MSRRSSIRRTTILNKIQEQNKLLEVFDRNIETIKKNSEEKHETIQAFDRRQEKIFEVDHDRVIVSNSSEITVLHINERNVKELIHAKGKILSFSQEAGSILIGSDAALEVYSMASMSQTTIDLEHSHSVVRLNSTAEWGISTDRLGEVFHWDLANPSLLFSVKAHPKECYSIRIFANDENIATLGDDFKVKIWSKNLEALREFATSERSKILEVSGDFFSMGGSFIRYPEVEKVKKTSQVIASVSLVAFSYDCEYLAVYDNLIRIFSLPTGQREAAIKPLTERSLKSLCFSKDSLRIYYTDGEHLFHIKLREDISKILLCPLTEPALKMCCDGPYVYFSSANGIMRYFDSDLTQENEDTLIAVSDASLASESTTKTFRMNSTRNAITSIFSAKVFSAKDDKMQELVPNGLGQCLYSRCSIVFMSSCSTHILRYDSRELRLYNTITPEKELVLTYPDVVFAVPSHDASYIIILLSASIMIYHLKSNVEKKIPITEMETIVSYLSSDFFTSIDSNSNISIYNTVSSSLITVVPVQNFLFTGTAEIFRDSYMFTSCPQGIALTSLQDYSYLGLISVWDLVAFTINIKVKKIFYSTSNALYSMSSFVSSGETLLLETSKITFGVWKSINALLTEEEDSGKLPIKLKNTVIMPYCVTPIMIYSSNNQILFLKEAMRNGFKYLRFRNKLLSPLTIAVCRKNKDVIRCLMKEIILAASIDSNIFFRVEDDILELNYNGATSKLEYFYENAFLSSNLKKNAQLNKEKFVAFQSDSSTIDENNFINLNSTGTGELVDYKVSGIRLKLEEYSQGSVEFLDSLVSCQNQAIFRTSLIQAILISKWRNIKWLVITQFSLFCTFLTLLTVFIASVGSEGDADYKGSNYDYILYIMLLLNTFFLIAEIPLFIIGPLNYILDPWNMLDSTRILFFYVYCILRFFNSEIGPFTGFLLGMIILLNWVRALAFFRIFKRTRYLIRLILEVCIDMVPFAMVLLYTITAFSLLGYSKKEANIPSEFKTQYMINFGQFDTTTYLLKDWMQFYGSSAINALILMTMIIALMNSTFERVQQYSLIADYHEMASYILEIESIFLWLKRPNSFKFFQFCYSVNEVQLGQPEELIMEKTKIIKVNIEEFKAKFEIYERKIRQNKQECENELQGLLHDVAGNLEEITLLNAENNRQILEKLKNN